MNDLPKDTEHQRPDLESSFPDSRFGTLVSPVEGAFHLSPDATGNLSEAGWQQDFRNERSGLLLEGKPIL